MPAGSYVKVVKTNYGALQIDSLPFPVNAAVIYQNLNDFIVAGDTGLQAILNNVNMGQSGNSGITYRTAYGRISTGPLLGTSVLAFGSYDSNAITPAWSSWQIFANDTQTIKLDTPITESLSGTDIAQSQANEGFTAAIKLLQAKPPLLKVAVPTTTAIALALNAFFQFAGTKTGRGTELDLLADKQTTSLKGGHWYEAVIGFSLTQTSGTSSTLTIQPFSDTSPTGTFTTPAGNPLSSSLSIANDATSILYTTTLLDLTTVPSTNILYIRMKATALTGGINYNAWISIKRV